jgi:3-isopropylmalate/(R)-2-methylmalate dehydratase small subunit
MEKFTVHKGLVAPLDRENVDTDAIIPKQFLKSIKRPASAPTCSTSGATWTTASRAGPGHAPPNPDFVLNQPRYRRLHPAGAQELRLRLQPRARPWALEQYGFRAILAPSFADIFFNNCFKNGLLPIVLPESVIGQLFDEVRPSRLPADRRSGAPGRRQARWRRDRLRRAAFRKYCLLNGWTTSA